MTGPPLPGSGAPIPHRRFSLRRQPPVCARERSRARHTMVACQLHHMLDARQAGPDRTGCDFLFVQSAGNGLVDGAPLGAYANGCFAGIDENLFEECFPEGEVAGISFGDVHAHTLVVGAARERTEGEVALQGDDGASVSADTLSRYQDAYDGALADMGVADEAMRSTFLRRSARRTTTPWAPWRCGAPCAPPSTSRRPAARSSTCAALRPRWTRARSTRSSCWSTTRRGCSTPTGEAPAAGSAAGALPSRRRGGARALPPAPGFSIL